MDVSSSQLLRSLQEWLGQRRRRIIRVQVQANAPPIPSPELSVSSEEEAPCGVCRTRRVSPLCSNGCCLECCKAHGKWNCSYHHTKIPASQRSPRLTVPCPWCSTTLNVHPSLLLQHFNSCRPQFMASIPDQKKKTMAQVYEEAWSGAQGTDLPPSFYEAQHLLAVPASESALLHSAPTRKEIAMNTLKRTSFKLTRLGEPGEDRDDPLDYDDVMALLRKAQGFSAYDDQDGKEALRRYEDRVSMLHLVFGLEEEDIALASGMMDGASFKSMWTTVQWKLEREIQDTEAWAARAQEAVMLTRKRVQGFGEELEAARQDTYNKRAKSVVSMDTNLVSL